jgi:NAD(P)-dependent dehydrogenase (short-subunit alcohol dehydrogenase family)
LTNSTSPYYVTAAFVPLLAKAASNTSGRAGSVINITSSAAILKMYMALPSFQIFRFEAADRVHRSQNSQYPYNVRVTGS